MARSFIQPPPNSSGSKLLLYGPFSDATYAEAILLVDQNGVPVQGAPRSTVLSSTNLAAGGSILLVASAVTNALTGRLRGVTVSASVPLKAEIGSSNTGAALDATEDVVFTTDARLTEPWRPPAPDYFPLAGNGTKAFAVRLTNQDTIDAANVYSTIYWDEV